MLGLVPVFLLISSVVLIWIMAFLKQRPGSIWLVAAIMVSITWVSMILVGALKPQPILINRWLPQPLDFTGLVLYYSPYNWGFGFLLVSLLSAVVFSEAKYLNTPDYVRKISSSILLTAFAVLAVMSRSLLTFVLSWAVIDLIEFGVLAVLMGQPRTMVTSVTSILFRLVGLFLLILVIAITPTEMLASDIIEIEATPALWGLIVLLVLFRTGTLPLFQPYVSAPAYQRGVVTILRTVPLLTTFAFIHYIIDAGGIAYPHLFWLVLTAIAMLWGGFSWFSAADELHGRPYFLFTLSVFGVAVLMSGRIEALPGLAVMLVIGGAGLFLYSPRLKKLNLFLVVLIAGMLAFPFTPTASLAQLFDGPEPLVVKGFWVLALAFLVAGMIRHSLTRVKFTDQAEPWMLLFHQAALYLIAFSPWVIVVFQWRSLSQSMRWWPGISLVAFSGLIMVAFLQLLSRMRFMRIEHRDIEKSLGMVTIMLGNLFKFNWLSRVSSSIGFVLSKIVNLLARVMEGDGGILWSFLFIVLLLSLLLLRQAP